jgi:XTP/dITP diphosphohydrolase
MIHWYNKRGDYWLGEYVIMPDHMHLLICPHKRPLSYCMRNVKRTISDKIHQTCGTGTSLSHRFGSTIPAVTNPQHTLWQSSFHDSIVHSASERESIRHYILENPMKARLCRYGQSYPFSSEGKTTDRDRIAAGCIYPDQGMPLIIGTTNAGKIVEIREALFGLHLEILSPLDLHYIENSPIETGSTFAENALQKARFYHERSGLPTLADDSGIIVEALRDELGIHTRRWGAGADASDEEWIAHFLKRMQEEGNKRARFVCVLAYIDQNGKEHLFEGTCNGVTTEELEVDYLPGLPISACFKPDGYDCVYSAMKIEQKNSTSHRGKALLRFSEFLRKIKT